MNQLNLKNAPVLVVGAGIMGMGIAQVAAQAGHTVTVFDTRDGAAASSKEKLGQSLEALVAKGKMQAQAVTDLLNRISPINALKDAGQPGLVIEAIIENLQAKRALFQELEALFPTNCILATNTSSLSVTAIANGLKDPSRLVGMHFFNPVPLMKLVEVVSGLQTAPQVAQAIFDLGTAWGKTSVHAKSTPGFIVNRIARPYYAETLALLQEQAAPPSILDGLLRGAGFRMGPCELMDLIGHDTNFSVTQSVFEANFFDRRFTPSLVQRELVDGGLLGRKSGRGFYTYPEGAPALPEVSSESATLPKSLVIHGTGQIAESLLKVAKSKATTQSISHNPASDWIGIELGKSQLRLTDGRPAWQVAEQSGLSNIAVFDELPVKDTALAFASVGSSAWQQEAASILVALGYQPIQIADVPGLVVARTISMLINEAADAVQQGVCTPEGADAAMKLGVNYPAGPFDWLKQMGYQRVIKVIEALDHCYRGERYRVSPFLQRGANA